MKLDPTCQARAIAVARALAIVAPLFVLSCNPSTETPGRPVVQVGVTIEALSCGTNVMQQVLPQGSSPAEVALSASDRLSIDRNAIVRRSTSGYSTLVCSGSGALPQVTIEGQVGNVFSGHSVRLSSPANVHGSVRSSSSVIRLPGVSAEGTIQANTPVPFSSLQRTITFPSNAGSSVIVPVNGTRTLTPGAYNSIVVPFGATLIVQPGEYFVRNLTVDAAAQVTIRDSQQPVYLYVRDSFLPLGRWTEDAVGDLAGNFRVTAFTCLSILLSRPWVGTLIAPAASVTLRRATSPHRGAVFARSISVEDNAVFEHVPFPSTLIQRATVSNPAPCQNETVTVGVTSGTYGSMRRGKVMPIELESS